MSEERRRGAATDDPLWGFVKKLAIPVVTFVVGFFVANGYQAITPVRRLEALEVQAQRWTQLEADVRFLKEAMCVVVLPPQTSRDQMVARKCSQIVRELEN